MDKEIKSEKEVNKGQNKIQIAWDQTIEGKKITNFIYK